MTVSSIFSLVSLSTLSGLSSSSLSSYSPCLFFRLCVFFRQFRLEMESEANKKEWQLRREKEKADILLRPSAGRFSLSSPLATTPVEVKELKARCPLSACKQG